MTGCRPPSAAKRDAMRHTISSRLLVDLRDVVAKGLFKQRLRTQVVPEAMHPSLVANRFAELFQKALHQLVAALRRRRDLVVARDALRLVVTNTAADQVDLVAEIVVQHAVRKLGLLRDLAQAGPRIAEFGQGLERRLGKFNSSRAEFVDTRALELDPRAASAVSRSQVSAASLPIACARLHSKSPRHPAARMLRSASCENILGSRSQGLLDKCIDFGQSSRYSWASVKFPSSAAEEAAHGEEEQTARRQR